MTDLPIAVGDSLYGIRFELKVRNHITRKYVSMVSSSYPM